MAESCHFPAVFLCYYKNMKNIDFDFTEKLNKAKAYTDSYDNEGFVPDFINYNMETPKGVVFVDDFAVHKKS